MQTLISQMNFYRKPPLPKDMRILGIDPALKITGYGIIEDCDNQLTVVEAGILKTSPKQELSKRLLTLYQGLDHLIQSNKPDCAVLEKLYVHAHHPITAYILGQAYGVSSLVCAQNHLALFEYPVTRVRKAIIGRGQASKEQIQRMVFNLLNLIRSSVCLDVTDALALAIAHSYISKAKCQVGV